MRLILNAIAVVWVSASAAWLLLCGGLSAADTLRQIGLARLEVTPGYRVRMTGYNNRKTEFDGVEQSLWAKALAIGSDAEGPAVLITVDNLGVPGSITDEVARRTPPQVWIETRAAGDLCFAYALRAGTSRRGAADPPRDDGPGGPARGKLHARAD
jgi:hypothetical protein